MPIPARAAATFGAHPAAGWSGASVMRYTDDGAGGALEEMVAQRTRQVCAVGIGDRHLRAAMQWQVQRNCRCQ